MFKLVIGWLWSSQHGNLVGLSFGWDSLSSGGCGWVFDMPCGLWEYPCPSGVRDRGSSEEGILRRDVPGDNAEGVYANLIRYSLPPLGALHPKP